VSEMRKFFFVMMLLGTAAFVLTDPRWSEQLVQPVSVSWGTSRADLSLTAEARLISKSPEARCAFARRWLSKNEEGRVLFDSELTAVRRVLESCQRPVQSSDKSSLIIETDS